MLLALLGGIYGVAGLTAAGGIVGAWVGVIVTYYFTREQVKTAGTVGRAEGGQLWMELAPKYLLLEQRNEELTRRIERLGQTILSLMPPEKD